MSTQETIQKKLTENLGPAILSVDNESHMHSGPATESHFKVTIVSSAFDGVPLVKRHQRVYGVLAEELQHGVHALALHLYAPAEWEARQNPVPESPDCRGGSKGG